MSNACDVSVVVSTYNRCHLLPAALDALLAQRTEGVSYEILLVDNNSTDRTRQVVESYLARGPGPLRYVFEPKQGLAHGRNAGIANARAPLIACTDDDICVDPDWVVRVQRAFDEHSEAVFIGGKVLPIWEAPPPAWLTREHWSPLALIDYGDAPFYIAPEKQVALITANAAFRRQALEEVGGFDPQLQRVKDGVGSMEDYELETRLRRAGYRGLYLPDLVVRSPVEANRTTKDYHRRWHRGHGHFHALFRDPLIENARLRLFGVPAHLYRQALCDWLRLTWLRLRGRSDTAFLEETRLSFFVGFFRTRRREFFAGRRYRTLGEVARFLNSLVFRGRLGAPVGASNPA